MIAPFEETRWSIALAEAFRWHEGQTRKSSGQPYVIHCVEVAAMLERLGFDESVVIAGLLHDTLEDTQSPPDRIAELFGDRVLAIVQALTERKCDENRRKRAWIDRKREHIGHLRRSQESVRAVALADQRQNLTSVLRDWKTGDPSFWNEFNGTPPDYLNYHQTRLIACEGPEACLAPLIEGVREALTLLGVRIADELADVVPKFDEKDWD
jgi:(p)ppGpp synthase/HD superfamily hydrolase